jgi:hypothetical protein
VAAEQPDTAAELAKLRDCMSASEMTTYGIDLSYKLAAALDAARADNKILQQMHYNQVRFVAESEARAVAAEARIAAALAAVDKRPRVPRFVIRRALTGDTP